MPNLHPDVPPLRLTACCKGGEPVKLLLILLAVDAHISRALQIAPVDLYVSCDQQAGTTLGPAPVQLCVPA